MRRTVLQSIALLASVLMLVGCSSDDATNPTGTTGDNTSSVSFTPFTDLVEDIAPPVFVGASLSPVDSMWNTGDYSLLGKVFGQDEPMSLYSNLEELDNAIELINELLKVDDSGNYLADSSWVVISNLTLPTTIPVGAQVVFGFTEIDVDDLVKFSPPTYSDMEYHIGFTLTDTTQSVLTYFTAPTFDGEGTESFIYYAYANLVDSSVEIKGVFFKDYGNSTSARWVYDIGSVNESDFAYRMSWFSDEMQTFSLLGCIIGGGNKDTEFALRYREYNPADSADYTAESELQQVFGPNYGEGTGLISTYADYLNESLIFTYSSMPDTLLPSPWAE